MKKKYGSILLAILMLFFFTACSLTVTKTENTTAVTSALTTMFKEESEPSITETDTETSLTLKETSTAKNKATEITDKPTTVHITKETAKSQVTASETRTTTKIYTTQSTTSPKTVTTTKAENTTIPNATAVQDNPLINSGGSSALITCTIEISCASIHNNLDMLEASKAPFVPDDGIILNKTTVHVEQGASVFDVLKKVCAENRCSNNCQYCRANGIQLEYRFTPMYNSYYIEGIHQLYEFDCGDNSGWMYSVNGVFPNKGCSQYKVKSGDTIRFLYTCSLGADIGSSEF